MPAALLLFKKTLRVMVENNIGSEISQLCNLISICQIPFELREARKHECSQESLPTGNDHSYCVRFDASYERLLTDASLRSDWKSLGDITIRLP